MKRHEECAGRSGWWAVILLVYSSNVCEEKSSRRVISDVEKYFEVHWEVSD